MYLPIILYTYNNASVSFYLTDGVVNTDEITSYVVFGQDMVIKTQILV